VPQTTFCTPDAPAEGEGSESVEGGGWFEKVRALRTYHGPSARKQAD